MNKLISRNPVQRFKQGKKLIKAQGGTKTKYAANNLVYAGRDTWGDYLYYDNRTGDLIKAGSNSDKLKQEGFTMGNIVRTAKELKTNPYISRGLPTGFSRDEIFGFTKNNTFGEYPGKLVSQNTQNSTPRKRAYYQVDPTDGSKYLIGTDGSRTLVSKGNKSNVNNTKVNNKSNSIQQRNPGAYHNITTWQNKLKDFYEPGKFAVDGIWGENTEAAYQKYLQSANSQKEAKEIEVPQMPTAPSSIYNLMNPVEKNLKAPLSAPVVPQTYNRTQVREFLRNKGVNPYSFSGDQRRAVRMVLNGQGTDEDKALVQSMGIFKKGGILPSRNPITRFRNRKFN